MNATSSPLPRGARFARYTIDAVLGEGGMGIVYRATDERLQRKVALKIVHDGVLASAASGSDGKARLLREARAAAALEHPNVVVIYDADEHEGVPYIAMELVEGRPLRAFVGDASVPMVDRVRWLLDVARALGAAHARGLVHRDVKPENVLVRSDGVAKVVDFGIARRAQGPVLPGSATEPALGTVTGPGTVIGTPLYMAPEQMRGEELDGRADQFAWGVMAYELLAGERPWTTTNLVMLVSSVLGAPAPPLRQAAKTAPPALADAVGRALAKAKEERFASMDALVTAASEGAPRARSRARTVVVPLALLLAAVLGALGVSRALQGRAPAAIASAPSASAAAAPRPTTAMDRPPPRSSDPAALAAYRDALQAGRDGSPESMARGLQRALELDPGLTAATLRLVPLDAFYSMGLARTHFARAKEGRANLDAHDQEMLDVLAPIVLPDTPDLVEHQRRARAFVEHQPGDAEALDVLVGADRLAGDFASMLVDAARLSGVDPDSSIPPFAAGMAQTYLGHEAEAERAFDECYRRFPTAEKCGMVLSYIAAQRGDCAGAERLAEQMIRVDPSNFTPYVVRVNLLVARGASRDAVSAEVRQAQAHALPPFAERFPAEVGYSLAALDGDFEAADKNGRQREAQSENDPDLGAHMRVALDRALVLDEAGDAKGAAIVAAHALETKPAWQKPALGGDDDANDDPTPRLLAFARRAGALSDAAARVSLDAWIDEWKPRLVGGFAPFLWLNGYVAAAVTRAEAEAAMDMRDRFGAIPAFHPDVFADGLVGRVALLAGRPAEAIEPLRRATHACDPVFFPVEQTQAHALLGQALEATGDRDGACAAYATVLARWGHAKPRSVSADAARAAVARLGCGHR